MDNNNYFFSNKSFEDNELYKISLFDNNPEENLINYNNEEDEEYNYNLNDINNDINKEINDTNELFTNSKNNMDLMFKLGDSIQFKNNNLFKDISSINGSSNFKFEEDSNNNNNINNNSSFINNSQNSSSTKEKSQLKNDNNNNINEIIIKEKEETNSNNNINSEKKEMLNKKRKPRVHLEDLGIDPEKIKDKKFETIGDKVFLSKNKILTEEEKKEVRAIRNRISAQKSRDRKKAEFIDFKKQIKYLTEQLNQKNAIIQNYEKVCCSECKSKFEELNNGELILEEEKNNFLLGKIPGILIGIVCLIGITLCLFQFNYNIPTGKITLRNLKNNFYNKTNTLNYKQTDEAFKIYEEPITQNSGYIKENNDIIEEENENEFLQMCHDKFTFDIYTNNKKKKNLEEKQKTGFLVKKTYNKFDPNSFCFETNTVTNGNYYINSNNNLTNTLPIQRDNIILNDYISNKVISVFIKDYESLKKYSNGKILDLKEQIERGVKNSEDGCIYLQLILPKNVMENDYDTKNSTCPNDDLRYFEIRAKILSYYNYYDRDV